MLPSSLDDIGIKDIEGLADRQLDERKHLEFKRALDPADNSHKKNFLKTLCAFANTDGGDLVIGISDNPEDTDLYPETDYEKDDYKQRWEDLVRSSTEPRVRSLEIVVFDVEDGDGFVTLVRVRPSNLSPHRATHGHTKNRFYARSNNDSYPMNVGEVREAFLEDYRLSEQVEEFVADRIAKIRAGNTDNEYVEGPAMVMHVVPSSAFSRSSNFDISKETADLPTEDDIPLLIQTSGSAYPSRRNVDGVLKMKSTSGDGELGPVTDYTQVYLDGRIEMVHTGILRRVDEPIGFWAAHDAFESTIPDVLDYLEEHGASQPVHIFISLLDIKGRKIAYNGTDRSSELDRGFATLPSVTVESFTDDYEETAKEVLRNITHAFGKFGDIYEGIER